MVRVLWYWKEFGERVNRLTHGQVFIVLLIAAACLYAPSLNHPFMIDDHTLFDATMNDIRNLPYQFLPDKAKSLGIGDGPGDVYYRPFALVIPMLSRVAFGPWVFGYHAVNLLLFVLAGWVIYLFFNRFLNGLTDKPGRTAFLTAFIFILHPINGLLVNYITASVFSAQVIFMLLSLYYLERQTNDNRPQTKDLSVINRLSPITALLLSLLFFMFSFMCHESAMALPFYGFILFFFGRRLSWQQSLRLIFPMLVFLGLYMWWRMDHLSLKVNILDKYAQFNMSIVEFAATLVKLLGWYLRQLFIADGIVVIWLTPIVKQAVLWWLLLGFVLTASVGYVVWQSKQKPLWQLALAWFATGFIILPFASLFHMPQMMIEPHWFIFSVIGFFLGLALAINRLQERLIPAITVVSISLLFMAWFLVGQSYNKIWSTELGYCQWWLSQVPQFKPIHATVARAYFAKGQLKLARAHYQQVLFNSHSDFIIYTNIGTIDYLEGKISDAKVHLKKAISIESNAQTALNTLGVIAIQEKDYALARTYFLQANKANPFAQAPKRNLMRLEKIMREGRVEESPKIDFNVPL